MSASAATEEDSSGILAPLFVQATMPLLLSPPVQQSRALTNRRKTLAGMDIDCNGGFSLRRSSARIKARRQAAPATKEAQAFVCRGLGIVKDGEDVTERAMKELADQFKDQVPGTVISALRALFQLD